MALFGLSKSDVLTRLRSAKNYFQQFQSSQSVSCEIQDLAVELRRLELGLRDMELLTFRTEEIPTCQHTQRKADLESIVQNPTAKRASYLRSFNSLVARPPLSDDLPTEAIETSKNDTRWSRIYSTL